MELQSLNLDIKKIKPKKQTFKICFVSKREDEGAKQFVSSTGLKNHAIYSFFKWLKKCAKFDLNDVKLAVFLKKLQKSPRVSRFDSRDPDGFR